MPAEHFEHSFIAAKTYAFHVHLSWYNFRAIHSVLFNINPNSLGVFDRECHEWIFLTFELILGIAAKFNAVLWSVYRSGIENIWFQYIQFTICLFNDHGLLLCRDIHHIFNYVSILIKKYTFLPFDNVIT